MILFHVGTTLVVLWFVFRGNTRLDYRLAAFGAILPDLVDKPIGRILLRERLETGRLWGHSLLVNVAFLAILFFMRGRKKRKLVLVPAGSLMHLAGDMLWGGIDPRVFFWPVVGLGFPRSPLDVETGRFLLSMLPQEVVGALLLAWLFAAHGMLNRKGIAAFLRTGHLEMDPRSDAGR